MTPRRSTHIPAPAFRRRCPQRKWEVHYDPYDVSRIWVRNHHEDGWLAATWTHLRSAPVPFGETLWRHARAVANRKPRRPREAEIAAIAEDLMDRAAAGPADRSKAERRVTGRTSAASAVLPRPTPPKSPKCDAPPVQPTAHDAAIDDDDDMAEVIPCQCSTPRKEGPHGGSNRGCRGRSARRSPPAHHDVGRLAAFVDADPPEFTCSTTTRGPASAMTSAPAYNEARVAHHWNWWWSPPRRSKRSPPGSDADPAEPA